MTPPVTPAYPERNIAIIGLGYVGLPLAVEFGKQRPVVGFDIDTQRIAQLQQGVDHTRETEPEELKAAKYLRFTSDRESLRACTVFIITVPTPIDAHRRPNLTPLIRASETVGRVLKPGDLVIYESTVYPGCTEEECVPVLERESGLVYATAAARGGGGQGRDAPVATFPTDDGTPATGHFFVGYSPERINPGDKAHRLAAIQKVTSGSTPEIAALVDALYRDIITAGTHPAPSIRVAEAAKVIENTQRDLNIALINELAILFNKLGIDTEAVLQAAGSKWNFLPFRPGLVGGHCIGVDPYYLTHKAQAVGYHPEIILAGRRLNDGMGAYVAGQLVKAMIQRGIKVKGARILVMGLTFKENCPDLRNTRVVDIVAELQDYQCRVDIHDPWVDAQEAQREYGLTLVAALQPGAYDAILLAVAHQQFRDLGAAAIHALGQPEHIVYDLKYLLDASEAELRL